MAAGDVWMNATFRFVMLLSQRLNRARRLYSRVRALQVVMLGLVSRAVKLLNVRCYPVLYFAHLLSII